MINPLVSAIITTHRRKPAVLERAIDSVIAQDYYPIELIVVDDAPDYELHRDIELLLSRYDSAKYYISPLSGANYSRNLGIEKSNGEYIAFLDDDDTWVKNKISQMVEIFDDSTCLVYCNQLVDGKIINRKKPHYEGNITKNLLSSNFIGGCSIPLISKKFLDKSGWFDVNFPSCQDWDLWIRLSIVGNIKYVNLNLVNYYYSENAITSSPERRIAGWDMLLKKYYNEFITNACAKRKVIRNIIYVTTSYYGFRRGIKELQLRCGFFERTNYFLILFKGIVKRLLISFGLKQR